MTNQLSLGKVNSDATFEPETAMSSSVTIVTQVTESWCPQRTCSGLALITPCSIDDIDTQYD